MLPNLTGTRAGERLLAAEDHEPCTEEGPSGSPGLGGLALSLCLRVWPQVTIR